MPKLEYILNLEKKFKTSIGSNSVLKEITFLMQPHRITAILGPSGCGKTTLLNIIAGLDKDYKGKIVFNAKYKMGYMFQTPSLIPWRTVLENICIGPEVVGKNKLHSEETGINFLKKYDLIGFENSYPSTLSQGMQQRVSLIRLLMHRANLLLLDEPFSKIDFMMKRILYNDINEIMNDGKTTIIMVTHDVEEAVKLADKIVVLSPRPATVISEIEIPIPREDRLKLGHDGYNELSFYIRKIWDSMSISVNQY